MKKDKKGLLAKLGERLKSLDVVMQRIEKQYGKGAIMQLGTSPSEPVPVTSTGVLAVDIILGVGGLPRGRVTEIFGPESSGKTTLALYAIAESQKSGGIAAFVDAEHALDVSYAKKLGVNVSDLLVSQPDTGEQALEITEMLVRSGAVDMIVIDSVAALVPRAEIEGEMGDCHVGLQARLMSQALRKLTGVIHRSGVIVIFINQIRMKIGVMFGSPETTTGGNALKFYSSIRLDVRRGTKVKQGSDIIGNRMRVKVVKNKVAPPFRATEFDFFYDRGICRMTQLIEQGAELGIVERSGSWYSYQGERLGQGRENACVYLQANPKIAEALDSAIRSTFRPEIQNDPISKAV